jgi:hypothetical protein
LIYVDITLSRAARLVGKNDGQLRQLESWSPIVLP